MDKEKTSSGEIIDMDVLRRIFRFVKPYKNRFYALVVLTILVAILSPALPFLVQKAIDDYIMANDYQGLVYITIALVGVLILQGVVQYLHTFLSGWVGQYVIRDIRIQLYRHLLNLRLKYFDRTPIGRLVTRNVSDIETLSDIFSQGVAAIIGDMLQIVVILGVMLYIDWKLTLVSLSTLPLLILSRIWRRMMPPPPKGRSCWLPLKGMYMISEKTSSTSF